MKPALVFIVACSGPLREGLSILLQTVNNIGVVRTFDHSTAMWDATLNPPQLILWDWDCPPSHQQSWMAQLQTQWPTTYTIALVDDEEQSRLATTTGVNLVLTKGTPAAKLVATINNLLRNLDASGRGLERAPF